MTIDQVENVPVYTDLIVTNGQILLYEGYRSEVDNITF